MRKSILLIFCLQIFSHAGAQIMPSTPQPATIQVATLPGLVPINPVQTANAQANNGLASYMADEKRVAADKVEQKRIRRQAQGDIAQLTGAKPAVNYSWTQGDSNDPRAAAYYQAYKELDDMLTGKQPASLKRAVFLVENAYYENKLDYAGYNKRIADLAAFCREKLREEKTDTTNEEAKNNMAFRLLSEPLTITDPHTGKKITSEPLHYDFDDFYGKKDWTKMFVTKLLNTGFGQCHSMPLLFVILSQEMGAKAYLSFSPSHSFAKYRSGKTFKNVELTNGHITTDAWVLASDMVKAEALKSHIYLDTVGVQAQIAFMMHDLALGYIRKYGYDYFVGLCGETSQKYYPNDAFGLAMKANYITAMFNQALAQMVGKTPGEVLSDPNMKKIHDAMLASYAALDASGYAEMHAEEYEDWIKSADKEKRKQEYELFLRYQKTHKSTLQNGVQ